MILISPEMEDQTCTLTVPSSLDNEVILILSITKIKKRLFGSMFTILGIV